VKKIKSSRIDKWVHYKIFLTLGKMAKMCFTKKVFKAYYDDNKINSGMEV